MALRLLNLVLLGLLIQCGGNVDYSCTYETDKGDHGSYIGVSYRSDADEDSTADAAAP